MPFKLSKTTPANLPWGKSVQFNGVNQYLTAPDNTAFNFGSSNFTIECWVNLSNYASAQSIFTKRNVATTDMTEVQFYVFSNGLTLYVSDGTTWVINGAASTAGSFISNAWNHIALTRNGTEFAGYINGTKSVFGTSAATLMTNATSIAISSDQVSSWRNGVNGYVSNYRILKGTALYTASFTVPTSPLNVVASASLLACHDTSIKDGSVNNFTITNNNAATVSTVTPFVVSTKSVLFDGSTQYLNTPSDSNFTFGTGSFTMEFWCNYTLSNGTGGLARRFLSQSTNSLTRFQTFIADTSYTVNSVITVAGGILLAHNTPSVQLVGTVNAYNDGNWHHVAFTRNGATLYCFVDGVLKQSVSNSTNFSAIDSVYIGGRSDGARFAGYMSNVRIVKGTALYTASFTALAEPLTSVASCSLLTCNAPTIVDSSTNNFTITNNGSATVSSVVPFNAVGYGYKFNNRNNAATVTGTQRAIFGYGTAAVGNSSITNLVSNTGVVAANTTGVGTARYLLAAAGYGGDKAIFGYGVSSVNVSMTNRVSNTGVVATDTTGVGTARNALSAAGYGTDKAIFGYGIVSVDVSMTNLVSNTGVVATDTTGVGTSRNGLAAASYGGDKAIFGYGVAGPVYSLTNRVSNTGVVSTDTTGVGTARYSLAAAGYGSDKAIFGYGYNGSNLSMTNLVSNAGVVATDTTGVGTARNVLAAAGYGSDKAIFGHGTTIGTNYLSLTNLVSNTGVVATDTAGVGTGRYNLAAAGFSTAGPAPSGLKFKKVYSDPIIVSGTQKAIFGYGNSGATYYSITNLVSNTGVVSTDTTGVGTSRNDIAAAGYGTDKAIFGYGYTTARVSMTNLVSNTGVVSTDTTGVGTARYVLAAAGYGGDKAIFGYGTTGTITAVTNLISNTGIVSTDTTGVGTARYGLAAAGYGSDKAIFGYGFTTVNVSMTNLVSNAGVVATDTTGVGTARRGLAAAGYGSDKAIFGYGYSSAAVSMTNLVSNTGVVATDTTGVGTSRFWLAAAGYGSDKAIFGYGQTTVALSMTNLVSNTGVVANNTTGVGTARGDLAAAGYSLT